MSEPKHRQTQSAVDWAESKTTGVVSEFTLLTPIKPGLIPGEMRTYEQRLRDHLESLHKRESSGIPSFTRLITNIHYARWFVLRPEQFLQYSNVPNFVDYVVEKPSEEDRPDGDSATTKAPSSLHNIPHQIDDFEDVSAEINAKKKGGSERADTDSDTKKEKARFVSWLIFTSNFDGDLKSYARKVAEFIGDDADRIWGNCYGYPGTHNFERWWLYARRHQIPTDAFYAAYPHLTVPRIHQLSTFKSKFDEFVARTRNPDGSSRSDIGGLFDEFLRENLQYATNFPGAGGIYDAEQAQRTQDLRK